MPDYAGPLQRLVLSRTLWVILVLPALGALWQLLVERRRPTESGHRWALVFLALTATATIAHVAILAELPAGRRALLEPIAPEARIGQLDVSLALWFDPLAGGAAVLACVVALAGAILLPADTARRWGWRAWAWIQLTLAAALVAFLADGFVTTAIGWSMASLSVASLAGWGSPRAARVAATRGAIAIAALLVGAVLLFYGNAGSWDGDDFVPDPQPQFVAARMGEEPSPHAPAPAPAGAGEPGEVRLGGTVTLTDVAGAQVFVDDARRDPLRSPFVGVPVRAGLHGFRIRRGGATEDATMPRVGFEGNDDIAIVPFGPTLAFRTLADQVSLRDRRGELAVGHALASRLAPGGMALLMAVLAAWLVAAAAIGAPPPRGAPAACVAVACAGAPALLGPYLLARVSWLLAFVPHSSTIVVVFGAVAVTSGAWRARRVRGAAARFLTFVTATPFGAPCIALGLGGSGACLEAIMASGFAAAGLHLVASRRSDWADGSERNDAHGSEPALDLLLVDVPERLGDWFVSMERWVVDAVAGAVAGLTRAGAWVVATADTHVVSTPVDAVAVRLAGAARRVNPYIGSMARVVWALLGVAALTVLVHALWPAR
jgi:hypothetical protein